MILATVYIDPTDTAIDHDVAREHFRRLLGQEYDLEIRPDARFVGRRPILVVTGGAA